MPISVDPDSPHIEVDAHVLRDVNTYLIYKELATKLGKPLKVRSEVPQKPSGAVVLSREAARDVRNYETAKAQAERENHPLWIE